MAAKTLYIVRGLPSAGKTTLAEHIAGTFFYSLDDARRVAVVDNVSDPADLAAMRAQERAVILDWMRAGASPIAVADVNARRLDILNWIYLAIEHGYRWSVVHVETDMTDADLAARSATSCPADAIANFRSKWEPWGTYGAK